jgi:hypothetical protein
MEEQKVTLCNKSLWWILGRMIHSKSVVVLGGDNSPIRVYEDGKSREFEDGRCYVEVTSDYDEDSVSHIIHIPSLVQAYTFSALRNEISDIVRENTI